MAIGSGCSNSSSSLGATTGPRGWGICSWWPLWALALWALALWALALWGLAPGLSSLRPS